MNRLQLCQQLKSEAGVSGALNTTIGQAGMIGRLVSWIDSAHNDIQSRHKQWEFLRSEFSFNTIAGTATYTPSAVGLADLSSWKDDSLRVYLDNIGDEQWLDGVGWADLRDSRLIGSNRLVQGRPTEFAIKPDDSITIWPVPDDEYTITGEYFKAPTVLTANATTPVFPERFHMAIVWRALMTFSADQEAMTLYSHAEKEFKRLMFALENDQLLQAGDFEALA